MSYLDQIVEAAVLDETLKEAAAVNPEEKFELVFKSLLDALLMERVDQNDDMVTRIMNDEGMRKLVTGWLASETYRKLGGKGSHGVYPKPLRRGKSKE